MPEAESSTPHPSGQRIAIVGGGVSGLVSAYLLSRRHDVTLFEAGAYPGGHTNTIDVPTPDGSIAVDTGFIVFNERNYPLFTRLLSELGVESQPSDMSFAVSDDATGMEYNGAGLGRLFIQRRNALSPRFLAMVRDIFRFNRLAQATDTSTHPTTTVDEFVRAHGLSRSFLEWYLIPLGASLWSCPSASFRAFPIRFVIDFLFNHGMLAVKGRPQWRVIRGGSREYVRSLIRGFEDRIRLATPVRSIRRESSGVRIGAGELPEETFDHVVIACHSDQALRLLEDPTEAERSVLGTFPYQTNETVLHTDTALLPRNPKAWASWNYRLRGDEARSAAITYSMNLLQSLPGSTQYCVTLNETDRIDPAKVIRAFSYDHPVYTIDGERSRRRHAELIDRNRTSYCGAYWGFGFHEDGVRSAAAVAERFGCPL